MEEKIILYKQDDKGKNGLFVDKLYEVTSGEAFIASDVGQHQMWAANYSKYPLSQKMD